MDGQHCPQVDWSAAHARFAARVAEVDAYARETHRGCGGRIELEDLRAAMVAHVWAQWHSLLTRGRDPEPFWRSQLWRAAKAAQGGRWRWLGCERHWAGNTSERPLMVPAGFFTSEAARADALGSPARRAQLRLDLAAWVQTQQGSRARVAKLLLEGADPLEIPALTGLSRRHSVRLRRSLARSWRAYQRETV